MSENIEKAVPTEESPKTKESETSAPAATDNVVLYPVADISAAQETTDTETAASKEITDPQNTDFHITISIVLFSRRLQCPGKKYFLYNEVVFILYLITTDRNTSLCSHKLQ